MLCTPLWRGTGVAMLAGGSVRLLCRGTMAELLCCHGAHTCRAGQRCRYTAACPPLHGCLQLSHDVTSTGHSAVLPAPPPPTTTTTTQPSHRCVLYG
jgi:hypothetical protein